MESKAINIHENNTLQIAENLQVLLKKNLLNINQLAQALGLPMMTIRRLISGETTDPRISTLKLIADHFGVTVDSLLEDKNSQKFFGDTTSTKPYFVPILDWDAAQKISTINEIDLSQWKEWQPISLTEQTAFSKNTFALESRPSMYPRFPQGTIFIIDPEVEPRDGDIVLVKIISNSELTLRELCIDPPEWQLQSIVPGSSTLQYNKQKHMLVGVNLLTMLYNRKAYV